MSAVSGALYLLVWLVFKGSGCGPPGHSTAGRIMLLSGFALPLIGSALTAVVGFARRWRMRTILATIAGTILGTAALEIMIFLFEFTAHHCGE